MRYSRKYQVLLILILSVINISVCNGTKRHRYSSYFPPPKSESDEDEDDDLSHRFQSSSREVACRYWRQDGVCRRRSECRIPTRETCRRGRGLDPVVCCLDKDEPTTTRSPTRTIKPQPMPTKRTDNIENIDITFPNCGQRVPNVEDNSTDSGITTSSPRTGVFSRRGRRAVVNPYLPHHKMVKRWDQDKRPMIGGGQEVLSNSWPWMAAIFKTSVAGGPKRFLCGASLISRQYVLSAAHCFDSEKGQIDASKFTIIIGSHTTRDGTEYPVQNVLIHPGYQSRQYYNDICLLKIGRQVTLTNKVNTVCLPSEGLRDRIQPEVNSVVVTGWGDTTYGGVSSKVLQEVTIPIVPLKECNASYSKVAMANFPRGITNVFICAGLKEGGKDACQGDSGGPMVNRLKYNAWVQLGVVSFGYGCAEAGFPGVYTRLSQYTKWLYENTDLGR